MSDALLYEGGKFTGLDLPLPLISTIPLGAIFGKCKLLWDSGFAAVGERDDLISDFLSSPSTSIESFRSV